jgi:hypothetical protein
MKRERLSPTRALVRAIRYRGQLTRCSSLWESFTWRQTKPKTEGICRREDVGTVIEHDKSIGSPADVHSAEAEALLEQIAATATAIPRAVHIETSKSLRRADVERGYCRGCTRPGRAVWCRICRWSPTYFRRDEVSA